MSEHAPHGAPWRRWHMDTLERPAAPAAAKPEQADTGFSARAELHALRQKVRDDAYQDGHRTGFEEGHQQGYEQGLEEGRQAGEQQAREDGDKRLAPLATLADNFHAALQGLDRQIADDLVDLALAVGRQLAGDALRARPQQVVALVRELLSQEPVLGGQPWLWLHPDDLALVEERLAGELAAAGWRPRADPSLERGGCRVSGDAGERDASGQCRWEMLLAKLRRQPREPDA